MNIDPTRTTEQNLAPARTPGKSKVSELQKYFYDLEEKAADRTGTGTIPTEHKADQGPVMEEAEKIREAAIEFQSMFVRMMLKAMRSNLHPENDMLFGGRTQEIFEDMLYDEHAKTMSKSANFPLADQIVEEVTRLSGGLQKMRESYLENSKPKTMPSEMIKTPLDFTR